MSDIDDQNTPNADISQSIDGIDEGNAEQHGSEEQVPVISGEMKGDTSASSPAPRKTLSQQPQEPDETTLVGRLEGKLAAVTEILWEKEAMQMRFTVDDDIREEYYRRWKSEGNSFLILAARLKRRLARERANASKKSA